MRIMVIGGGGREHAIIRKIRENPAAETVYALPGNGGIAADAECVAIGAKDIEGIVRFAKEKQIDYAIVAPDDPLVLGCVNALEAVGVPCFGPRKEAAIIEGSKVFAKGLMKKYGIPTAEYEVFEEAEAALRYLETAPVPTVIKADGLALGKGVTVAMTREEAAAAVREAMEDRKFGESGSRIVIEEFLEGPEVSVLSFTDGETIVPMVSSMDHKRALDGDRGPNTGGMGTIAPNPFYTEGVARECMERIFLPTIRAMKAEGREFRGCLYLGLMITREGPKVIEYNCRFGDPETQVVLPLMESDLLDVMRAVTEGRLKDCPVRFRKGACCCVVEASEGYPGTYRKGFEIRIPEEIREHVYVAGAELKADGGEAKDAGDETAGGDGKAGGHLVTSGGRVLGVTATGRTLEEAVRLAYERAEKVTFGNRFYRKDIGRAALEAVALAEVKR